MIGDSAWLEIVHPDVRLGAIRRALFDFDGTLSTIREGWERIMAPLMIEMICGGAAPQPEIVREVEAYIDYSTGILTIEQMAWLAEAVHRHGLTTPKTAREYKQLYAERLLVPVRDRLARLAGGEVTPEEMVVAGAHRFVEELFQRGIILYLVSGTDHEHVVREAGALGLAPYFGERIYGALDDTAAHTKKTIITRLLDEHVLQGKELLVVGDGRVEIQLAKERGAVALGVASDEVRGCGWNPHKRQRLLAAGADLLVADFTHAEALAGLLLSHAAGQDPSWENRA